MGGGACAVLIEIEGGGRVVIQQQLNVCVIIFFFEKFSACSVLSVAKCLLYIFAIHKNKKDASMI